MNAKTTPTALTPAQRELLVAVQSGSVVYSLGSKVRGMSKTSAYRRLDTGTSVTAAMKRLREAGLVSPTGRSQGMGTLVVLTAAGQAALSNPA